MTADIGKQKVATQDTLERARSLLISELGKSLGAFDLAQLEAATRLITDSGNSGGRIFVAGAGRSGLALKMAAMRLMHLGLTVFVAGETTTPAITAGDLLIAASASGKTASIVHAAETAQKVGAQLLVITSSPDSAFAAKAEVIIVITAASKNDMAARASEQYAGSLFEQSVLLVMDTVFHALWKAGTQSAEQLLTRHANLE